MKTLSISILLLFAGHLFSQTHNEDIIKFVNDNMGKKVGKGLCFELVQGAVQSYDPSFVMGYKDGDKEHFGKPIKKSSIQPGDILYLSGGTKQTVDHVCIVYKIDGDDIYVAEQNTKAKQKDSIVVVDLLDYEADSNVYGKVVYKFYHPR